MMAVVKLKPYPLTDIHKAKDEIRIKTVNDHYEVHMTFTCGEERDRYYVEFDTLEEADAYLAKSQDATKRRNYILAQQRAEEEANKPKPPTPARKTLRIVYDAC